MMTHSTKETRQKTSRGASQILKRVINADGVFINWGGKVHSSNYGSCQECQEKLLWHAEEPNVAKQLV